MTSSSQSDHADRGVIARSLPSVVQIVALRQGFLGNLSQAWTGSGTIVTSNGIILTNCHVADPRAMGMPAPPADKLAVSVTERSDAPPVLTYYADIVAKSPQLDLAVLQITSRLDRKPLSRLNLPFIPLGDSDDLELGDVLSIFGYPGIGGETVTFTSGSVSGFTQQQGVGDRRAWVKTDATIAGGNSGGTAVDHEGRLVGVPTQAAAGEGITPVDARPVVDTNRDGRVDQRDTPMAIGGFINGLRPINLAKPMLDQAGVATEARPSRRRSAKKPALRGTASVKESMRSRGGKGAAAPKDKQAAGPSITNLVFSSRVTRDGRPISAAATLPSGLKAIYATFQFESLRTGSRWGQVWAVDGKQIVSEEGKWADGPRGHKVIKLANNKGLPDGQYHLALTFRRQILAEGQVQVGRQRDDRDTQISGRVVDRATGRGINGALVIVLKPGVAARQFVQRQERDMAFTSTRTDRAGNYTLPRQLPKGQAYSMVVVARGYQDVAMDGALRVSANAPETATISPLPLMPG